MAEINIRWTREAELWHKEIFDFISQDDTSAAENVIYEIYDKIQILKIFPEIGYVFRSELEGEIRILLYGHYKIAYLIKDIQNIDILGIFHSTMDIDRYI